MSRKPRTYVRRVAHNKPLRIKQWYSGTDVLPDNEPTVEVTDVRFTKKTARNGEVRIVITGKPLAIRALSRSKDFDQAIAAALVLGSSP